MNAHPHKSCTPTEPHTHSSAGHAPTAMLRAGQPHSPATPSHAVRHTEPSNACTAPSTQTQPQPASHTLMPPCAQPHLGLPPADPPTVTRAEPEVGVCARGQRQYADTGQPSEVSSPAGQMPARAQARSSPRHEGTPGGRRRPAGSFPPGRAQRSCPCPALQPLRGASGTAGMDRQLSTGATEQGAEGLQDLFLPPIKGTGPRSFLSLGWGCRCLLPACLHRAPQGRTDKCTAQIQVKQENHLFYSKSWKLQ